jgi:hypothetical protein
MASRCRPLLTDPATTILANFAGSALELLSARCGRKLSTVREGLLLSRPRLDRRTISKIQKLSDAYAVVRHLTTFYAADLLHELDAQLKVVAGPLVFEMVDDDSPGDDHQAPSGVAVSTPTEVSDAMADVVLLGGDDQPAPSFVRPEVACQTSAFLDNIAVLGSAEGLHEALVQHVSSKCTECATHIARIDFFEAKIEGMLPDICNFDGNNHDILGVSLLVLEPPDGDDDNDDILTSDDDFDVFDDTFDNVNLDDSNHDDSNLVEPHVDDDDNDDIDDNLILDDSNVNNHVVHHDGDDDNGDIDDNLNLDDSDCDVSRDGAEVVPSTTSSCIVCGLRLVLVVSVPDDCECDHCGTVLPEIFFDCPGDCDFGICVGCGID